MGKTGRLAAESIDEQQRLFGPAEWGLSGALALIWGSSFLWIAIAIDDVSAGLVPVARCGFGVAGLLCIPAARRRVERAHLVRFALTGLCWMTIPFLLYPLAEQTVDSSIAGMINGGLPVMTTVVTALFTRTRPSAQRIAAVCLGTLGIAIISLSSVSGGTSADAKGIALLIVALVFYAVATNIARPLQATYGALPAMLWITVFGCVWSLPVGIASLSRSHITASAIGALFVLGFIGTGFAFAIFSVLLTRAGPVRGMIGIFFTPIGGLVLGITVRHDPFHWVAVLGMAVVIAGAVLTARPEPTRRTAP